MAAPLDGTEFARWREQADRALTTAGLARSGSQHEWACFLAEQAAQFGVKGLLHGVGADAWGHDLSVLWARADGIGLPPGAGNLTGAAARLSRHYIATRYPDAHASGSPGSHYTDDDAAAALDDATQLLAAVDAAWSALGGDP